MSLDVNRREFLKITAGAGAAMAMPTLGYTAVSSKMIGIQVGAISFVDEGTEKVLDVLQERAGVNTLFLAVFTYGRGIAGRQIPGQPLPDHGKQEYDLNFHGGNFATPHPQYYKNTVITSLQAWIRSARVRSEHFRQGPEAIAKRCSAGRAPGARTRS